LDFETLKNRVRPGVEEFRTHFKYVFHKFSL